MGEYPDPLSPELTPPSTTSSSGPAFDGTRGSYIPHLLPLNQLFFNSIFYLFIFLYFLCLTKSTKKQTWGGSIPKTPKPGVQDNEYTFNYYSSVVLSTMGTCILSRGCSILSTNPRGFLWQTIAPHCHLELAERSN